MWIILITKVNLKIVVVNTGKCDTITTTMTVLGSKDLLKVKFSGLAADYDRDTIVNLYQPIVGYTAMAIYFSLWSLSSKKYSEYITHEQLFSRMQIAPGRFVESRKLLEATGLLKSYVKTSDVCKKYSYVLYAPKSPKDFFDDTLLYGMLVKCVGVEEADSIKSQYIDNSIEESGEDISEKFIDVFKPSFDDPVFTYVVGKNEKTLGRNAAKIKNCFDYEAFFKEIAIHSDIDEKNISSKEMKEIERLALLNGTKEKDAANIIINIYDGTQAKGKRIDLVELAKAFQENSNYKLISNRNITNEPNLNDGNTVLASKINLMETVSPKEFLSFLQNGTVVARSDLNLINSLSANYNLPNCVINALVDYVLTSNDNILSRPYCEKIATSLAREGVSTTIDAMNYLKRVNNKKKRETIVSKSKYNKNRFEKQNIDVVEDKATYDEVENISWDELMEQLDKAGGGYVNGKN